MANLTKEQLFSGAMMAYMSELKGGFLKKFCETKTATGGESVTFTRIKSSTANKGEVASMFEAGFNGTGGDMKPIKATITEVYAQDKIKESDMNKTSIDIKNAYVKSLGNAVMRKEDAEVIQTIVDANPVAGGTETAPNKVDIAGYTTDADVKKVIAQIRRALALAKHTPDNHRGVALVMSAMDWADLSTSDYVLNNDYSAVFGGGTNGEPTTFYGAEVIISEGDANVGGANHKAYIIPSNTVCFAEWEGSMRGDAVFVPTDGLRYHLQAVKSVGVALAEPAMITQLATA